MQSCTNPAFYDEFVSIPANGWSADSILEFNIELEDTSSFYWVEFSVRNNSDYPFSNLFLFREVLSDKGLEYRDTAEYFLADQYGKWLGTGAGELKTSDFSYRRQGLKFKRAGIYTFRFQHAMRVDVLEGIEDFGLRVYQKTKDEQE